MKKLKLLLRSIPGVITGLFLVSIISMNLLANKTIVSIGDWFALDGGIVISWITFLTMDLVTKHFGPKEATLLSIFGIIINLLMCVLFYIVSIIPSEINDYTVFNSIFGGTWFILLDSTIAFILSSLINNFLNYSIGKMFKKESKLEYITRTYISTFVGQFIDNIIFSSLTFMIFAPIFWNGFSWTFLQCVMCSLTGAVVELLMEVIFSPVGYKICKKWKEEGVGNEYFNYRK